MKKVVFIASSGGHLAELLQMKKLFKYYRSYLITEKDSSTKNVRELNITKKYYLLLSRRDNIVFFICKNIGNIGISLYIFFRINPDVVISTGANTAVPFCYIAKLFRKKIIFIETFAVSKRKTLSGKLIYPIADVFFVQWESMLKLYPKAIFKGSLY